MEYDYREGCKKRTRKRKRKQKQKQCPNAYAVRSLNLSAPMFSANTSTGSLCICPQLKTIPGKVYTFGRSKRSCDVIFEDCRVSRLHCQLYCHSLPHRNILFLLDGTISDNYFTLFQNSIEEIMCHSIPEEEEEEVSMMKYVKPSVNGIYVNGRLMKAGHCRALCVGDEVSLVSHPSFDSTFGPPPGFVVEEAVQCVMQTLYNAKQEEDYNKHFATREKHKDEAAGAGAGESVNTNMPPVAVTNRKYDPNYTCFHEGDKHVQRLISRASLLLRKCHEILKGKDIPFNPQNHRGDPHHCSRSSPQSTQVCSAQKTQIAQIDDANLCHSNIGSFKKSPDSSGTSVLNMDAGNGYKKNRTTIFHAKTDKSHVNCNNELDSSFKVALEKNHVGIERTEDCVVSKMQTGNKVVSKNAGMHATPILECNDNEPSHANNIVSNNKHKVIPSEARQVRLDRDLPRLQKNNAPIIGKEIDLANIISNQQTVNESYHTLTSNRLEKNNYISTFPELKTLEPSAICQSYKSEDLENIGRQGNIVAGSVQKYAVGNNDQRGTAFPLDISDKNPCLDSRKIYTEKGAENVDKPVTSNICMKVTPEYAHENGQQKLSLSNWDRFETEERPSCSNVTRQNAFNYMKVQEEISACNDVNRFSSEAVPRPLNEEQEDCHENVNIILTDLEKQASLREINIVHKFFPSNDEVGRLTDQETNVKDIDSLLKEIHTEILEDNINSDDGEIREEANDLDWEEDELRKGSSIDDPVLLTEKAFCLNRLEFMEPNSCKHPGTISLRDLLVPVDNLLGIFCTTFTSDILWFLSYCRVPSHLPVTIVCHNTERCWSRCDDQRWSRPFADRPNLTVVYPSFPETIAFGKGPRQGVGCHHSKMILLYRKESIRLVITSANLGPRQWLHVTNTVWWQDFPRTNTKDFLSLFKSSSFLESKSTVDGDFAAHLAGFIATLISCVPTEAHWVEELTHYDFRKASAYLVASVPGMHGCPHPHPQLPVKFQHVSPKSSNCTSASAKYLGIVPTSVVGLSYHFRAAADPKGERLKALATLLRSSRVNMDVMMPVMLRRTLKVSADSNAISVIVCDINGSSEDIFVQEEFFTYSPRRFLDTSSVHIGFLPKDVATWIAPLWDGGIFSFSAYIFPHETLETASGRSSCKIHLILKVFSGQNFARLSTMPMCNQHSVFICNLLGSLQRPYGLWRLQEVLSQYKWPNSVETDFIYGSSSIGMSLDARFLAAFSAAAGRKSTPSAASDETDPEWGCWDAHHESEDPSIGIVFPTIERVKSGKDGTLPYSRLLCFAESTWERLKSAKILHDAIPYPGERVGSPMHTKVARRRFQYCSSTPSFGWIYCGSHNFSPAAWGRPLIKSTDSKVATSAGSVLGSTLHICNYEIGLVFIVPPPEDSNSNTKDYGDLDNFTLPFVVPAPKYKGSDRPATSKAMCEARIEMLNFQQMNETNAVECLELVTEEAPVDEDNPIEDAHKEGLVDGGQEQEKEEKVYAETLWSQFDSCRT